MPSLKENTTPPASPPPEKAVTSPSTPTAAGQPAPSTRSRTRLWQKLVLRTFIAAANFVQKRPRASALRFGRRLGAIAYHLDRKRRRYAERNLRLAYGPALTEAERSAMSRRVFEHWGKCTVEFLRAPGLDAPQMEALVSTVEGEEYLESVRALGTGFILVSGHLGNFEFMGRWLASRGVPSTVVARDPSNPEFARYMRGMREYGGNVALPKGTTTARELLAVLRRKEILTLGVDQNSGDVFVPFFGVPAGTVSGPALLALRTGVPLLPAFCVWEPDDTYRILFLSPIFPRSTGDKDADIARTMAQVTEVLESVVRRVPDQWLWLHHRWKSAFEEKNRERWPEGYDFDSAWQSWTGGAELPRPEAQSTPRP